MKRKKRYSMFGRVVAFVLVLVSMLAVPLGAVGTYYMVTEGYYITSAQGMKERCLDEYLLDMGRQILWCVHDRGQRAADEMIEKTNLYYVITHSEEEAVSNWEENYTREWTGVYSYNEYEAGRYVFDGIEEYSIELIIPVVKDYPDYIAMICFLTNNADWLKVLLPLMVFLGVVTFFAGVTYLLCGAGWNRREEKQTAGAFGFLPTDIFTALIGCIGYGLYVVFLQGKFKEYDEIKSGIGIGLLILLALIYCVSISARVKAGTLWRYTLVGGAGKYVLKALNMGREVVQRLPSIWKAVVVSLAVTAAELWVLVYVFQEIPRTSEDVRLMTIVMVLWLVETVVILNVVFFVILKLHDLQEAGRELAEGNVNYKVNTSKMFGGMKEHGENLNRISEGVVKAVNERMKSEHLKTELITNVSHDIKTPLTSIINYSDLIEKEETENEKIKEYAEVLHRQSSRLKKLIEDLVDASKASTGNVEVNLEICDVGVLLEQACGEFSQRMFDKNMDLVSKQPQEPVRIMADPKLLWRVFDNLMTNICKYAMAGTRVYLSVEEQKGQAVISFKNISEYPLDITAEELMERFVRGDRSRHTEGNGLGLSIAKSLTELQNGSLELVVDGDLFKVLLSFPVYEEGK